MLLFGKVSGNLPDCEKLHSKSNEESISHHLSDSQHHTDTIHRRDRENPQGPQSQFLAEEPCRGNALLPGVEDRVAQLDLRRRAHERRPLALDGRDAAHAQHAPERQRPKAVRHGEGPLHDLPVLSYNFNISCAKSEPKSPLLAVLKFSSSA